MKWIRIFETTIIATIILFSITSLITSSRASNNSDVILIGEVKNIESKWRDNIICSDVTVRVIDVEKGSKSLENKFITVECIGGEVDGLVLWRSDQPTFMVGETVKLHLQQEEGVFTVIGGASGKFSVKSKFEQTIKAATVAGYKLWWYKPGIGWLAASMRPGPDWYGPLRWDDSKIPVKYWIDTRYLPSGVTASSLQEAAKKAYQTWEDDDGSYIDYAYMGTKQTDPSIYGPDSVNIFCYRYIDGSGGVLGVCIVWGELHLNDYDSFRIVDADIVLDTCDPWSAATTCPSKKFDVQNVATHEVGHNLGLADLYDPQDTEMTMYGYANLGETKKRTLEWGDQAGLRTLYPLPSPTTSLTLTVSKENIKLGGTSTVSGALTASRYPKLITGTITLEQSKNGLEWQVIKEFSVKTSKQYRFSYSWKPTEAGNYVVRAKYSGDETYPECWSNHVQLNVERGSTDLKVSVTPQSIFWGKEVKVTVTLSSKFTTPMSGEVVVYANDTVIRTIDVTCSVRNMKEIFMWMPEHCGKWILTAEYSGDNNYQSATSKPVTFKVNKIRTILTLKSNATRIVLNQAVNITIALKGTSSPTYITGQFIIEYSIGSGKWVTLDTITIEPELVVVTNYIWAPSEVRKYILKVTYLGDEHYEGSTKTMTLVVS